MIPDDAMEAVEKVLDFHLPDAAHSSGCQLRCGYDGEDMSGHLAAHVLEAAAPLIRAQALEDAADELARLQYVSPSGEGRVEYEHMLAIRRGGTDTWLRDRATKQRRLE